MIHLGPVLFLKRNNLNIVFTAFLFLAILISPYAFARQEPPAPVPKAAPDREKVFDAQSFTLDNGMQIVVIPNKRAPVVTHMVWYKVGAASEPQGSSGIAHFLEHLMFKGSAVMGGKPLAPGEFSKTVRRLGGQDNAFTAQDYTAYYQSVPSDQLETVMRMEAGRMRGMSLPESEVKSERNVILEERRQRTDNDPRARFGEQLAANAYINHPYGTPVIGWQHEIEKLTRAKAKTFYNRWYAPNNAILVVSGDVNPAKVFSKAIDIYGRIPKEKIPPRVYTASPPLGAQTSVQLQSEAIRQPMVQTLYRVPSARQNKDEALALEILAEIMGGGPTSRLYQSLVSKQKIASAAGLDYDSARWDDAGLWLYANPLPGKSAQDIETALQNELRKLVKNGVSDDELKDAVSRMGDAAIYARDSLSGPAMIIGRALVTGSSLDDVEYWPEDLKAVTTEQIQEVVKKFLDPDHPGKFAPVTGVLLPATATGDVK